MTHTTAALCTDPSNYTVVIQYLTQCVFKTAFRKNDTPTYTGNCTQAKADVNKCTKSCTLSDTNKHWVLQGYFWFFFSLSLSVQMKCLSSQILCEKHIQVIKSNPLWIRLLFESNRQLWDVACLCTWPGSSSNVPSSSSSWGLMICTSTLRGQLPRAFNPQRYDTMLDVVSSIRISLLFLFSSLFPSFPL